MSALPLAEARIGRWRVASDASVAIAPATWVSTVEDLIAAGGSLHRSKHADTYRWSRAGGDVYVKVYRRYRRWTALKDWFRPTKAANVLRVSARLTELGFLVPRVLAIGEERRVLGGGRTWAATAALAGEPIADRVAALGGGRDATTLRAKRGLLASLGREVARLHRAGVVAGDLVPANVWIALAAAELRIAFLDHDRTRIGGEPAAWARARRNLVQLNRVVVPGVTATDRLRVYRAYGDAMGWTAEEGRRRLPWVVTKTLARRRAERGGPAIPRDADFRSVMRADGPYAGGGRPQGASA
jgi:tRNA A-37 threonylcarbamoyl transferase component Bud32